MYKIYYLNHVLYFSSGTDKPAGNEPDFTFVDPEREEVQEVLEVLINANRPMIVWMHTDREKIYKRLDKVLPVVKAGGGVVYDQAGRLLLIKRLGKWDLPKGKLDEGETLGECAVREVGEECQVYGIELGEQLGTTYHAFKRKGKFWLKESHWFHMVASDTEHATPQLEEDIEEIKWEYPEDIHPGNLDTYPAIRALLLEVLA
jgi:ADP-ribose pyrophosphatase YjhB (NUDIX family)